MARKGKGLLFRVDWGKEGAWMKVSWWMKVTGREGRYPAEAKDLARAERWWFYFGPKQADPWVFWNNL